MPSVIVQRHEAVFEIVLNRPDALNAANRELIGELAAMKSATSASIRLRLVDLKATLG